MHKHFLILFAAPTILFAASTTYFDANAAAANVRKNSNYICSDTKTIVQMCCETAFAESQAQSNEDKQKKKRRKNSFTVGENESANV